MAKHGNEIEETIEPDRSSAVEHAVGSIRELMRTRSLKVGDILPTEMELAAMFGTGRNTIREAVRILKAYGIVESRQKMGTIITDRRWHAVMDLYSFGVDISADIFQDIQGFRRLVEINLAEEIFARADAETILRLRRINEELRVADIEKATELDFAFHEALIGTAGNRALADIYSIMRPIITRLMHIGKEVRVALDGTYLEHEDIIQAIEQKDRIAYAFHMSRHLKAGLRFVPPAHRAAADGAGE